MPVSQQHDGIPASIWSRFAWDSPAAIQASLRTLNAAALPPSTRVAGAMLTLAGAPDAGLCSQCLEVLVRFAARPVAALEPLRKVPGLPVTPRDLARTLCAASPDRVPREAWPLLARLAGLAHRKPSACRADPAVLETAVTTLTALARVAPAFRGHPMPSLAGPLASRLATLPPTRTSAAALAGLCANLMLPSGPSDSVLACFATMPPEVAAKALAQPDAAPAFAVATARLSVRFVDWLGRQAAQPNAPVFRAICTARGGVFGCMQASSGAAPSSATDTLEETPMEWLLSVFSAAAGNLPTLPDPPSGNLPQPGQVLFAAARSALESLEMRPLSPHPIAAVAGIAYRFPPAREEEVARTCRIIMETAARTDWRDAPTARAGVERWLTSLGHTATLHLPRAMARIWLRRIRAGAPGHPLLALQAAGLTVPPAMQALFHPLLPGTFTRDCAGLVTPAEYTLMQAQAAACALAMTPPSRARLRSRS